MAKQLKYTKNEINLKYNKIKEIKLIPKVNHHGLFLKSFRVLGHTFHPNLTKRKKENEYDQINN